MIVRGVEKSWRQYREKARARIREEGLPIPEHDHWRWDEKAVELSFTANRCLGIRYGKEIQGLVMVSLLAVAGRSIANKGKPLLYVKYIETAPWDLRDYIGEEAKFSGVGTSLIVAAIEVSIEEEFKGRIALHSLPQAEQFYSRFMEDLGVDKGVEGLRYFELSDDQANKFIKGV